MRRILRVDAAPVSTAAEARTAFQKSVAISAIRCTVMYLVFPFVLPAAGVLSGVGTVVGAVIAVLAIVSIIYSMRRFWRAHHRARWAYTAVGAAIIVAMVAFTIIDISRAVS
jgi:uncharacterized membrane protein